MPSARDSVVVTASALNLRSTPKIAQDNILASLHQGQELTPLDQRDARWWKVSGSVGGVGGVQVVGFAAAEYLCPKADAPELPEHAREIEPVHCALDQRSRRSSIEARHCPLSEADLPRRAASLDVERNNQALDRVIDALDVEHSARYQPTARSTYCNVYAYDVCYLAQVYLPRVWWNGRTLIQLSQHVPTKVEYGKTVHEMTANALYDWLCEWGDEFGWERCVQVSELQGAVNRGGVGVICAKRRDLSRSGHITCVIPEPASARAERAASEVSGPLQSQAGAKNKQRFRNRWWIDRAPEYSASGFWHHP
jgi:hypothetical protein